MKKIPVLLLVLFTSLAGAQNLKTPEEFLGYELGDRFTRHHRVVEYFQHVANVRPDHVKFIQYGETNEFRPLVVTILGSAENIKNLEQIRLDNLRRTGLESGTPASKVAIVWLSYNVHGNEANSMEAAMKTLYDLADPSNTKTQNWLKNTVVIIDPCINPDGRDRYANFYNQYGNNPASSNGDSKEHHEPWPGGRANHYLFDLNRDWAWQTQVESKARIKLYNEWMPHVHVDFHEQSYSSPYYFAPAAEPLHEVITKWQREFETMIGKNNASYFDKEGWLYFTKESFDLFYPSYGDSYPMFNGAIGMTYEQAGGGYGGLTIQTPEGDPLTLKDRLTHHYTTGMSTVEITAQNAGRVVDEFGKYFQEGISNSAPYKTYVIKGDNNPDKLKKLMSWFDTHKIQYGYAAASRSTKGFDFQSQQIGNVSVTTSDVIVNINQPKGRFITTLFEPKSKLNDSITYDITAWNLMYGYDLNGYALNELLTVGAAYKNVKPDNSSVSDKPYAYLFRYQSLNDAAFLGTLLQNGINVRVAEKPFSIAGENFDRGTLIVPRRNNESVHDFDRKLRDLADEFNRKISSTSTGFMDRGKDLGSGSVNYLADRKIAILGGEGSSSLSFGEVWHFFEQEIHYPVTVLDTDYFRNVDLTKYNVLVIPSGRYRIFDESTLEKIQEWVSSGGTLVVMGGALNSFADEKGFALKKYATEEAKKAAEKKQDENAKKNLLVRYEDYERTSITESISGAIYKVTLDQSHPLAFGLGPYYYSLRTSEMRFDYLVDSWNVGTLRGAVKPVQGFAGYQANKNLANSLVFGVEDKGRGQVVYLVDNPLFRSFWENGKMLFANAIFMVGQ